jgi:glycogen debranching enzyme
MGTLDAPMDQDIRLHEQFYILASAARAGGPTRVLKHGDTFAIFDHLGDIVAAPDADQGLYHADTRYLSRLQLFLNGQRPLTLSSSVRDDNDLFMVDLTNPDIYRDGSLLCPRGVLHIVREKFLWEAACYERLRLTHYGVRNVTLSLALRFDADFADIFEVRGQRRQRRGRRLEPLTQAGALVLVYEGLDGVTRRTTIECLPAPDVTAANEVAFTLTLPPQQPASIDCTVRCESPGRSAPLPGYEETFGAVRDALLRLRERRSRLQTSSEQFNVWIRRSSADMDMLLTRTTHGVYPYAGVPWYNTAFSRDGIITALEMLWLDPTIARGVLAYLAATQATELNPQHDAEPGKILHEARGGEMAALREVPFKRYYGSVDATPLFVLLAGAYYERTADLAFLEGIWPNIEAALRWIDTYGDADGDGFVEYVRRSSDGLVQHGWKDSPDSVFYADGTLAEPPVALCEVQAYVYRAKCYAADLFAAVGRHRDAARLAAQADELRVRFEALFWSEELSMYAMALDGRKQQCRVRSSNATVCSEASRVRSARRVWGVLSCVRRCSRGGG